MTKVKIESDIGDRKSNQDSKIGDPENGIYIIGDGIGGGKHTAGDLCSHIATQIVYKKFLQLKDYLDKGRIGSERIERRIDSTMKLANSIISHAGEAGEVSNWGTTLDACFIHDKKAYFGHSGDSIIYHINNQNETIEQLTRPHNADYYEFENLNDDEIQAMLNFQGLENYVGIGESYFTDTFNIDFNKHDIIVMATDGISKTLSKKELMNLIIDGMNESLTEKIVQKYIGKEDSLTKKIIDATKNPRDMKLIYENIRNKGYDIDFDLNKRDNTTFMIIYGGSKWV